MHSLLNGKKVKIYYDRHNCSSIDYLVLEGTVDAIYDNMILVTHMIKKSVQVRSNTILGDKVDWETRCVETQSLINMNYVIRIDIK